MATYQFQVSEHERAVTLAAIHYAREHLNEIFYEGELSFEEALSLFEAHIEESFQTGLFTTSRDEIEAAEDAFTSYGLYLRETQEIPMANSHPFIERHAEWMVIVHAELPRDRDEI